MDEQITKRSRRFSFSLFRPRRSQEQECVEQLPTQPLELEGGPKSLAKRDLRRGSFSASALTTPKSSGSCITSKAGRELRLKQELRIHRLSSSSELQPTVELLQLAEATQHR